MKKTRNISRRNFIGTTVAAGAAFNIMPSNTIAGPRKVSPNDRINLAFIGAGGQGNINLGNVLREKDVDVVAIADPISKTDYSKFYYKKPGGRLPSVDRVNRENDKRAGGKEGKRCKPFIDYREMLDKQKDIDAVLIATPDHVHAVATIAALKMGKHVYCEKPLTHTIHEARAVRKAAKEAGVATQMGNHGHSGWGFPRAVEWIKGGAVGNVKEIVAYSNAGRFGQSKAGRPTNKMPLHESIDNWDLWIGPAPYRDYHKAYAPFNWRGYWDFGGGALGDMACHHVDQVFAALDLEHPTKIVPEVSWRSDETAPIGSKVVYHCPKKGDREALTLTWYDGPRQREARPPELEKKRRFGSNGVVVRGDKNTMMCDGWAGGPRLIPESAMQGFQKPPKFMKRYRGHWRCWFDAIKGKGEASGPFEYSARLTEFVLLGVLAMRVGETIEWDGEKMEVTNIKKANEFVSPEYRKGWSLKA